MDLRSVQEGPTTMVILQHSHSAQLYNHLRARVRADDESISSSRFVLSVTLSIFLDTGIGFYITYKYREIEPYASLDDPTFQDWKTGGLLYRYQPASNVLLPS